MSINRDTSWFTDLLTSESDSGYRQAAEIHELSGDPKRPQIFSTAIATVSLALVGIGFAAAAQLVQQTRPIAEATKTELIQRIDSLRILNTGIYEGNKSLQAQNLRLEQFVLPDIDGKLAATVKAVKARGGYTAIVGNGLEISLTQLTSQTNLSPTDYVLDSDLQIIVNGLWESGAKAIEINGIRITATTTIRTAGAAVLIDFQPVLSPFVLRSIGPYSMRNDFAKSDAYVWYQDLTTNYPVEGSVMWRKGMSLSGGTMPSVKYAEELD